jgi:hypothetical protein
VREKIGIVRSRGGVGSVKMAFPRVCIWREEVGMKVGGDGRSVWVVEMEGAMVEGVEGLGVVVKGVYSLIFEVEERWQRGISPSV